MIYLLICVVALALAALLLLHSWREEATPAELQGDWWPQFEREFRAYVQKTSKQPGPRTRRARHPDRGR